MLTDSRNSHNLRNFHEISLGMLFLITIFISRNPGVNESGLVVQLVPMHLQGVMSTVRKGNKLVKIRLKSA